MNTNELLGILRSMSAQIDVGREVRRSQNELKRAFDALDEALKRGEPLPDDWTRRVNGEARAAGCTCVWLSGYGVSDETPDRWVEVVLLRDAECPVHTILTMGEVACR